MRTDDHVCNSIAIEIIDCGDGDSEAILVLKRWAAVQAAGNLDRTRRRSRKRLGQVGSGERKAVQVADGQRLEARKGNRGVANVNRPITERRCVRGVVTA